MNLRRVTAVLLTAGLIAAAGQARAGDAGALSLNQAVSLAFQNEEVIQIAQQNLEEARLEKSKALKALWPDISFSSSYGYYQREFAGDQATDKGDEFMYGLTLNQPIYTGGRAISALRSRESLIQINRNLYDLTREGVYIITADAFFNYMAAEKVLEASGQGVKQAREFLDLTRVRFEIGEVTRTSQLRAEFDLARRENEFILAENGLSIAREYLRKIVQQDFSTVTLDDFELVIDPDEVVLEDLIQEALGRRKELLVADEQVAISEEGVKSARGQLFPLLYANGYYSQTSGEIFSVQDESMGVNLNLNIPIYDRGFSLSDIKIARVELTKSKLEVEGLKKNVRLEVEERYYRLKGLKSSVQSLERQVALAEENSRGVEKQYEVGISTDLDVSTALFDLLSARVGLVRQKYNMVMADLELQKAVGTLKIPD